MSLADFASVAEIVGAIGVIITLIYLTLELRRNTAATRQQSYHNLVTRRSTWFDNYTLNPDLVKIFIAGQSGDDLDEIESQQYVGAMLTFMSHFQDVYMQHRSGIVEKSVWDAERKMLAAATSSEGFQNWWKKASQYFVNEFVEEVGRVGGVYPVIYDRANRRWVRPENQRPWEASKLSGDGQSQEPHHNSLESDT